MKFEELAKINVNTHTEKKGSLTYLSWAWAVDQLLRRDDAATWEYRFSQERPYVQIGETCMVFCTVTAFGKSRTAQLPVMDHRNKAIPSPDAMQVNTAMQRCLAKAIALHGIGLYIYAGEDLPETEGNAATAPVEASGGVIKPTDGARGRVAPSRRKMVEDTAILVRDSLNEERDFDAYSLCEDFTDPDEKVYLWSFLNSKERARLKAQAVVSNGIGAQA
jgi:hypothetical protein